MNTENICHIREDVINKRFNLQTGCTSLSVNHNLLRELYEGLITFGPRGELIPGVAESWEISEDGRIYTFTLRTNARWSNGDPVTADDFVFAFRNCLQREEEPAAMLPILNAAEVQRQEVDDEELGVRALSPHKLEIELEKPTHNFLELLTDTKAFPYHPEDRGSSSEEPGKKFFNGAFVINWTSYSEALRGDFVEGNLVIENDDPAKVSVRKNPYYHDTENVRLDEIVYHPVTRDEDIVSDFKNQKIHIFIGVGLDQTRLAQDMFGDQVKKYVIGGMIMLRVNISKELLNDLRIRKALSLSLDRESLIHNAKWSFLLPSYSFVPPGIDDYEPAMLPEKDMTLAERREKARELLAEAGFDENNPLTLQCHHSGDEYSEYLAQKVQNILAPVGIEVEPFQDGDMYREGRYEDDYDIGIDASGGMGLDPWAYLKTFLAEDMDKNVEGYENPRFEALMAESDKILDGKKRMSLLHEAEAVLLEDLPSIPFLLMTSENLVSDQVEGWYPNMRDIHLSRYISLKP